MVSDQLQQIAPSGPACYVAWALSMSLEKRRREAEKRRKREAKAADRARRKADKLPRAESGNGEDPDIAGIVPGPQPHPFYDEDEVAQISDD